MPFVRGRIIPETQNTGRVKRNLDVLLWLTRTDRSTLTWFDELEQLRAYLDFFQPPICSIRLLVAADDQRSWPAFQGIGIQLVPIQKASDLSRIPKSVVDQLSDDLKIAAATALQVDADCVVTDDTALLPYAEDFNKADILLTNP